MQVKKLRRYVDKDVSIPYITMTVAQLEKPNACKYYGVCVVNFFTFTKRGTDKHKLRLTPLKDFSCLQSGGTDKSWCDTYKKIEKGILSPNGLSPT